ncbi:MAG: diguanylate cyclase [Chloroflexi bacterium]|nr:diguanylate cyclase [Chloroflexota bacterium]
MTTPGSGVQGPGDVRVETPVVSWGDQLQSIQKLGYRLATLTSVGEIGQAICTELRQLIDYHNVRVYRVRGDDVAAVAWRGEMGEYGGEDGDQLGVRVGQGITGWVAEHGIAQYLPDAAHDPRAQVMAGTDPDLPESMLLAPMRFDDRVIGVIVLSKLGTHQFSLDDLRYLEIYASMAAQAMANADTTSLLRAQSEVLAHQLEAQRQLLRATESILSTLDPGAVVEQIAAQVGSLVPADTLLLATREPQTRAIRLLFTQGVEAGLLRAEHDPDVRAMADWVERTSQLLCLQASTPPPEGLELTDAWDHAALVVAPLRGSTGVAGGLCLLRGGPDAEFTDAELELIQLFAGHVAIALRNAGEHQAVEIRAQTDALTGLKNQGTFRERLDAWVRRDTPFALLIIDLDGFKAFNDARGHEAGNALLREIAEAFRATCRETDEVFRYGGDEFAIILPGADTTGAVDVADRVGRAVRAMGVGPDGGDPISCSVGVATFPADAGDRDQLVLAADRACYAAKAAGRGRTATAADGRALADGTLLHGSPTVIGVDDPGTA